MRKSILSSILVIVIALFFAASTLAATAESVVQGLVLETVQAWKRTDGQSRRTVVVRNTGTTAFTSQMGRVVLQNWQLVGSTWQPAGADSLDRLAPGAAYERVDLPFQNQGASQFKATIVFNNRLFSEKIVPIQSGEPSQASASVLEGRAIAQAATLEEFSASVDANSRSTFNLTIRNNTDKAFTEAKNGLMLLQLQTESGGYWRSMDKVFRIADLNPRGVMTFTKEPFPDKGYYQLRAVLTYDKGAYATGTVPIAGAAERDARASQIVSKLTIQSFDAWRQNDGSGRFTLVVKNNAPSAFVSAMGQIVVQNYGLIGNSWIPASGWAIDGIPANGTGELRDRSFNAPSATRLAVELKYKDKLISRQEKTITGSPATASQASTGASSAAAQSAATAQAKIKVTLKSMANGKFVCAENSGAKPLIANRTAVGPWETFEMVAVGTGRIALKSLANGRYVCAENAGKQSLIANRTAIGPWETFEKVDRGGGLIALKSVANGKYVCAENAGAKPLIANRTAVGPWETFIFASVP